MKWTQQSQRWTLHSGLWFCHFLDKDREVDLEKKSLFYWTYYTTSLRKITSDIYEKCWYWRKGLATMNTHMLHECSICFDSKVMTTVKFFLSRSKIKVKVTGSKSLVRTGRPRAHICNMKSLSLLVQKLWPRLSFTKIVTGSKSLVRTGRPCQKEPTYVIWNP